jgi:hypothetical protein
MTTGIDIRAIERGIKIMLTNIVNGMFLKHLFSRVTILIPRKIIPAIM